MTTTIDLEVDASGLACPMPIVRAKKALGQLGAGQVIKLWSTDSGSVEDVPVFAQHGGHTLLAQGEDGGRFYFVIRKA